MYPGTHYTCVSRYTKILNLSIQVHIIPLYIGTYVYPGSTLYLCIQVHIIPVYQCTHYTCVPEYLGTHRYYTCVSRYTQILYLCVQVHIIPLYIGTYVYPGSTLYLCIQVNIIPVYPCTHYTCVSRYTLYL